MVSDYRKASSSTLGNQRLSLAFSDVGICSMMLRLLQCMVSSVQVSSIHFVFLIGRKDPSTMMRDQRLVMIFAILGLSLYSYILSSRTFDITGGLKTIENTQAQRIRGGSTIKEQDCSIYVAPSSLKGFPGLGIYTTRDLWKGEPILGGPDGISIPIETAYHQRNLPKFQLRRQWANLWGEYWWGRGVPDHVTFESIGHVADFQIGFGFLPNHHCLIDSLNPQYPRDSPYEDSLANRFESPGSGSFSYSKGREFTATRDVSAGLELFMSYGYCKHGNHVPVWTNDTYLPEDFNKAADYIWDRIGPNTDKKFHYDTTGAVVLDDEPVEEKLVLELLPASKDEVQLFEAAPLNREKLPVYLAETKGINRRTPEWIRENGMCLHTLTPRTSTLPHAGQGGFAQHSVKKNDMIVLAPLLHILDKDILSIYDDTGTKQTGIQLLMNYCFGNSQSTVLLCPTTNAVLINHCSHRKKQCGPNGPNAGYRWSQGWDETSDQWRNMSLRGLAEQERRGLSFEIYALRDIHPGEEVFLDYGEEWEEAWERHVQSWRPPKQKIHNWISAKEANERGGPVLDSLVVGKNRFDKGHETVTDPYLFTACVYWPSKKDQDRVYQRTPPDDWRGWSTQDIVSTFADDGSSYRYWTSNGYAQHSDGAHWPCTVSSASSSLS